MRLSYFVDQVEQHFEDPRALERIRIKAAKDARLSEDDRQAVDERIATYLADHDHATGAAPRDA